MVNRRSAVVPAQRGGQPGDGRVDHQAVVVGPQPFGGLPAAGERGDEVVGHRADGRPVLGGRPELGNTGFDWLGFNRLAGVPIGVLVLLVFAVAIMSAIIKNIGR